MGCGGDVASKLRLEVRVGADQEDQSKSVWCTQRSECACLPPRRVPALGEVGSRGLRSFHLFLFSPPLLPGEQNYMTVTWAREVWKHVSPCCSCSEQSTWATGNVWVSFRVTMQVQDGHGTEEMGSLFLETEVSRRVSAWFKLT